MAARYTPPRSLGQRLRDADHENGIPRSVPQSLTDMPSRIPAGGKDMSSDSSNTSSHNHHPKPLPTPSKSASPLPNNLLPSAPTSPPTPAPSPTPHHTVSNWQSSLEGNDRGGGELDEDEEDDLLLKAQIHFSSLGSAQKQKFLVDILNLCDNQQLSFISSFISPRLRKDPFLAFPNEICLRVLSFVDDPKTLARASQVSKRWHELINDDITWKHLCDRHAYVYRRPSDDDRDFVDPFHGSRRLSSRSSTSSEYQNHTTFQHWRRKSTSSAADSVTTMSTDHPLESSWPPPSSPRKRRVQPASYRTHFKKKYMVESAWHKGGRCAQKHVTPDQGVVTSLHLTSKYIVVALDNAKIHVYDTSGGNQKTLEGHVMGVWAMVPWDDLLVSGGCDREVRVWNMATGACTHLLRGHTSTVRCLKMSDKNTAISGSRDTTLRIWDLVTGNCRGVLVGHQASVRCLGIHGDLVVSGSYDTTARIWSISEGRCLRTLSGHFSQIYAIAFDGRRIATGSLDTSVRIWDPSTGQCHAILQGHTSLVGQLQMRGDTLVTGGSDGSVRVWSLTRMAPIHRLAAHDNSVTSLQFDSTRIVSGGSDGRVKVWDLKTGQLLRELSTPAEAVWRVAFEEEKAVIMASRSGRTVMEVWSFAPPPEELFKNSVAIESASSTPGLRPTEDDQAMHHHHHEPVTTSEPPPPIFLGESGDQAMTDAPTHH
ncbi:F-box and WD repeat-containing protein [Talaromyces stipitatus ATCC 10500]|uniref:Probable E3 ubiquitin ligase complex SCF subunit sconB n=1 Tax=Talaromyces stipitatus (strain ATCC 10500 / CBS 375.48 / QM 6759 / NRRL 1006) TaxID=441959 RepID=B8MLI9_TALSN|nr:F-box and WD repeat-containing protein [Talaromyces stipitatus ATCC 10500]EED15522.1 F-box and WD repeat-containing protein [Talaromyces stipitatus ATCC 10500]